MDRPRLIQRAERHVRSWFEEKPLGPEGKGTGRRLYLEFMRFWVLVGKAFIRNRLAVRASALAYSSLLALIPVLALMLSVTTSILKAQGEQPIRDFVEKMVEYVVPHVSAPPEDTAAQETLARVRAESARTREQAVRQINEFIDRTQSGTIGVTSSIVLLGVAIAMLTRIEGTFNDIWGVARGRSWYMRVVLYWAAITLGPITLISALGPATAGQIQFSRATPLHIITDIPFVKSVISTYLPLAVLILVFSLVYLLLPNTRVRFSAALVSGLTAGVLWHLNNKLGVIFASRVTSNNAVYGSLAIVPIIMIGMYFGWMILLFGAQVGYVYQNRRSYLEERIAETINHGGREFAALRLMLLIGERFHAGKNPPTLEELTSSTGVPTRLGCQILETLRKGRLVFEVYGGAEAGYAPARPIDQINAGDILDAMRKGGGRDLATREDSARALLRKELGKIRSTERAVARELSLTQLIENARSPAADDQEPPTARSVAEVRARPAEKATPSA